MTTNPPPRRDDEDDSGKKLPAPQRPVAHKLDVIRQDRRILGSSELRSLFVLGGGNSRHVYVVPLSQSTNLRILATPLSGFDLRMLHALAAALQGEITGRVVTYHNEDYSDEANDAWGSLGKDARRIKQLGVYVTTLTVSTHELARVLHRNGNTARAQNTLEQIRDSLLRLSTVSLRLETANGRVEYGSSLIQSVLRTDHLLRITLSPLLVSSLGQSISGTFKLLSMEEVRSLRTEAGILLHSRLSAMLDQGQTRVFKEETLEGCIYGDLPPVRGLTKEAEREARKVRRKVLRRALVELTKLDPPWKFEEHKGMRGTRPMYSITRPHRPKLVQTTLALSLPVETPPSEA
mgnify:FL=1